MSQHRSKRARGRTAVKSSDIFVGTSVRTRIGGPRPDDKAGRQAAALQNALKTGTNLATVELQRRYDQAVLIGTQAAMENRELTPSERKRDGAMAGYQRISTERDLVDMEREAVGAYQTTKTEELEGALQRIWDSRTAALDIDTDLDRMNYRQVKAGWDKIISKVNDLRQADAVIAVQRGVEDDITINMRHEYETTGAVDWQKFNNQMIETGIRPQRINDIIASTARDIGERAGDTSVIGSLPEKWDSGAPSVKNIGKYTDQLRNSLIAAENRAIYNERKSQADGDKEHKEIMEQYEGTVFALVLSDNSDSLPNTLRTMVAAGFDPAKARAWINFGKSYQAQSLTDDEVDWNVVADIERRILFATPPVIDPLTGEVTTEGEDSVTLESITAEMSSFGSSKEQADIVGRLSRNLRAMQSSMRNDPTFTSRRDEMKAYYTSSLELERELPQIAQRRTEALRLWSDLIFGEQGMSPDAAMDAVRGKLDDDGKVIKTEVGSLPAKNKAYWENLGSGRGVPTDLHTIAARTKQGLGSYTKADVAAGLEDGEDLLALLDSEQITKDEYATLKGIK